MGVSEQTEKNACRRRQMASGGDGFMVAGHPKKKGVWI